MGSLVFGGNDFGAYCACEVVGDACVGMDVSALGVPGRAGRLLLGAWPGVRVLRVRLRAVPELVRVAGDFGVVERDVAAWLGVGGGHELALPDGRRFRDAVCTSCGAWDRSCCDAVLEVELTCYDPVAYGRRVVVGGGSFEVACGWPGRPVLRLVADAGDSVSVGVEGGGFVEVSGPFVGGEVVVVDCEVCCVTVGGVGAAERVSLESDFFGLPVGAVELVCEGCAVTSVEYDEGWL